MAVSSIKCCWYKFSARIRDYLDTVDSYYRPNEDSSRSSRQDQQASSATKRSSCSKKGCSRHNRTNTKSNHHHHHQNCDKTNSAKDKCGGCSSIGNNKSTNQRHSHHQSCHDNSNRNCCCCSPADRRNNNNQHRSGATEQGQQQQQQVAVVKPRVALLANENCKLPKTKVRLPPGFSKKITSQGQVFFCDSEGKKYWYDPTVPRNLLTSKLNLDSVVGKLSKSWEVRTTTSDKTYYVNHVKRTTQFTDPRMIVYRDFLLDLLDKEKRDMYQPYRKVLAPNQSVTITSSERGLPLGRPLRSEEYMELARRNHPEHFTDRINPPSSIIAAQIDARTISGNVETLDRPSRRMSNQGGAGRGSINQNNNNSPPGNNLNRYRRNLLSGSHQNLSTAGSGNNGGLNAHTNVHRQNNHHSNTLTGPMPAWFRQSAVSCIRNNAAARQAGRNTAGANSTTITRIPDASRTTLIARSPELNYDDPFSSHAETDNISGYYDPPPSPPPPNPQNQSNNNNNNNDISIASSTDDKNMKGKTRELCDKISILRQELLKQQVLGHLCRIDINRKRIFEESFRVVSQMAPRDLKRKLVVKFRGEEGLDYGGVAREWFYLLSREILNPVHGLFQYTSDDIYNLQINPDSGIVYREHLSYFNFCGRIIGMAMFHGHFIEGHFTLPFYKMLLKKPITLDDIEFVDPELHRSLCWILETDITNVIDTTFLVQHNAFGQLQEHELKENGRNLVVTEENKHEYVSLYVNYRCRRGIESQFEALQRGFYEIILPNLVDDFDEYELELLIGGLSKINIDDWRLYTKLKNCTIETPLVKWFWKIVKTYDEDKRARLLQFVTGSPRVPIQGFKALQGVNSELRLFTIHLIRNACTDNLPKSHTCFNRIDLPPYETYEKLRDKLTQAIEETMGFAMQ